MNRDLRSTPLYREIEAFYHHALAPAFGRISGATELAPAPDGQRIAFTGSKRENLEGHPIRRICLTHVVTGGVEEVTAGPNSDFFPRWSPDGTRLAFLSDRADKGLSQLYVLESQHIGEAIAAPPVNGMVEYLAWSPDGQTILLGVAGAGADLAGVQGSGTTATTAQELPAWIPHVETGSTENQWRNVWFYDVTTRTNRVGSRAGLNVWEATWAGPQRLAAIVSQKPDEGAWYTAPLALIDVESGKEEVLYESTRQLGMPAATRSGRRLAVLQAVCSDRQVIAGDVLLFDLAESTPGTPARIETLGVDVTHLAWRDEAHLLFSGVRGLQSVYGEYDAATGQTRELCMMDDTSGDLIYPLAMPLGAETDAFALVLQSHTRFPEIAVVAGGELRLVTHLAHEGSAYLRKISGQQEQVRWTAPDGLEIEGFLTCPQGPGPYPLIVQVHGGPVAINSNSWGASSMLVSRGYAVLRPNPRGSTGRGQAFAEMVYGDMGGDDTQDILSGIDALIERGIVDASRVGVMGGSYGGYMTCWLVTQTSRFAAAVALSPVTDWVSQHYTCNIGYFDQIFLQDHPANAAGRYRTRSPLTYASQVQTPTLLTAGIQDHCTPPTQAEAFHQALIEHGVISELVLYPNEGHGVRTFPAVIDWHTRIVGWFERFMSAHQ